ncbi:MAG: PIG-L family deacetylase [Lachnospiraceae bacterium]|nr:PIG-L family deacetylase [Lachnospiraceae bacterium]MDD7628670.1 PIG-L family deacetylase [Lachnospiraceae bacterium]MDY4120196.1 PIG-L family deacetylase [Lachnospiraceae bacterium]
MNILFIAPHQDDEILAAGGLIQKCVNLGDNFMILFVTNGDYCGPHIAQKRYYESKQALEYLGIREESIFYLGYGDTGMKYSHSFLRRMSFEEPNTVLSTPFSSMTYHPAGRETVHFMRTGLESPLTQAAFLADLEWFIKKDFPDIIIAPNFLDMHGDHATLIHLLQKLNIFNQIPICLTYIIHGGNDILWPLRNTKAFTCPPVLSINEWKKRISVPLTKQEQIRKYRAIAGFTTQLKDDSVNFMVSFSKQEEVFFLLRDNEINRQNIYNHFGYKEIS